MLREKTNVKSLPLFYSPLTGTFTHQLLEAQFQQNRWMEELIHTQQESMLALTLPDPEVPTFNGSPMEYWPLSEPLKTSSKGKRLARAPDCTSWSNIPSAKSKS